ncbi:helix-turn-helix protein [Leucobacter luti]|uniref:Helix-turn-helix protein n=2 Tax=Leucobacter luti TaxID=340320 RepID=A0A4R6S0Z7_9MICO|nr:helix-turn-helix protein [Leucobacter luti]
MSPDITRRDLGRFVTERRRATGLTQRELAARLHVTESAVSKWERGLSYPDITMVQALAKELGVTGQELLGASEDHEGRADKRDAKAYRGWRSAILWSTGIAYAAAILSCFIVNISVSHTLSWFWIVLPAVALAFCLTTLPLLKVPQRGWAVLGGALVSFVVLMTVVWAQFSRGPWIWLVITAVLFGLLLIFVPILLRIAPLPAPLTRHRTVLSLAIDTVALVLFLGVVALATGQPEAWPSVMLPLAAIGAIPLWLSALIIRYLPGSPLWAAALVSVVAAATVPTMQWAVSRVVGEPWSWNPELLIWSTDTIQSNIQVILVLSFVLIAVVLAVAALVAQNRRNSALAQRS